MTPSAHCTRFLTRSKTRPFDPPNSALWPRTVEARPSGDTSFALLEACPRATRRNRPVGWTRCWPNPCPLVRDRKGALRFSKSLFDNSSARLHCKSKTRPPGSDSWICPRSASLRIVSEKIFTPSLICPQLGGDQVCLSTRRHSNFNPHSSSTTG